MLVIIVVFVFFRSEFDWDGSFWEVKICVLWWRVVWCVEFEIFMELSIVSWIGRFVMFILGLKVIGIFG